MTNAVCDLKKMKFDQNVSNLSSLFFGLFSFSSALISLSVATFLKCITKFVKNCRENCRVKKKISFLFNSHFFHNEFHLKAIKTNVFFKITLDSFTNSSLSTKCKYFFCFTTVKKSVPYFILII